MPHKHQLLYLLLIGLINIIPFGMNNVWAQEQAIVNKELKYEIILKDVSRVEILQYLAKTHNIQWVYNPSILPKEKMDVHYSGSSLTALLDLIFLTTSIEYFVNNHEVILSKAVKKTIKQDRYSISGFVRSSSDQEPLIGASVIIKDQHKGVATNVDGFYSLTLPKGNYQLIAKSLGHSAQNFSIKLEADTNVFLTLEEQELKLEEVTILNKSMEVFELQNKSNEYKINPYTVWKIPNFLGESDLIKTLQLLPGVLPGAEGGAGLHVRGGSTDQNLILLDGVPIFNATHLMGYFSIFSPELVKEVDFYKDAIPAQYGGRLSSVIDVRTKSRKLEKGEVSGNIGTVASRLTWETPMFKKKGSLLLSARYSYLNALISSFPALSPQVDNFNFYDINAKFTYHFKPDNQLSLSFFYSRDHVGIGQDLFDNWENGVNSLRWTKALKGGRWYSDLVLYQSNYQSTSGNNLYKNLGYTNQYTVSFTGGKWMASYYWLPKVTFNIGTELIYQSYLPGNIQPIDENSQVTPQQANQVYGLQKDLFGHVTYLINKKWTVDAGLRYSSFDNLGPGQRYIYQSDSNDLTQSFRSSNIIDTISYENAEIYHTYDGLEPRITLKFFPKPHTTFRLSYNRTAQYIHQLTTNQSTSPIGVWIPATPYIKPETADVFSIGYRRFLNKGNWMVSVDLYTKAMYNLIDFKPLSQFLFNDHLETEIVTGNGTSNGLELMIKKSEGKLHGWISYTLSETLKQMSEVNNGMSFPTTYDNRHHLSLVLSYDLNEKWSFSTNWYYATGAPYTPAAGKYEKDGFLVPYFSSKNSARFHDGHRLDLSITYENISPVFKKVKSSWNFSIYNVYGQKNPYGYIFKQSEIIPGTIESTELYFYTLIPSLSYKFRI